MKTLICSLIALASINLNAATWTFHNFKDNYLWCWVMSFDENLAYDFEFNFYYDGVHFPGMEPGYSLVDLTSSAVTPIQVGYSDSMSITVDDTFEWTGCALTGPAPNYDNWTDVYVDPNPAGEYWVDWSSTGTVRISTTQPADFGKWAWDGSVNPSWVEPLVVHGRGKALGHAK